ncbi:TetR/AcrR family transcriptional regulator [Streptomyces sp. NPDC056161]|uniref:TetR/AcrR family transcriptional regulator n=1 Tax=Streptomyces sp. NPDC056161 TaxID=3345732 RepID=UPI0035D96975
MSDRKEQIIEACLAVMAREGVAGTTHRRVAAEAGVPLGSTTYHFASLNDLLHCAFDRFARRSGARLETALLRATDRSSAVEAITDVILAGAQDRDGELVLTQELYTIAARRPEFRDITTAWMHRSRTALERHFPPDLACTVDALIEGLTLHGALESTDSSTPSRARTKNALLHVISAQPCEGTGKNG